MRTELARAGRDAEAALRELSSEVLARVSAATQEAAALRCSLEFERETAAAAAAEHRTTLERAAAAAAERARCVEAARESDRARHVQEVDAMVSAHRAELDRRETRHREAVAAAAAAATCAGERLRAAAAARESELQAQAGAAQREATERIAMLAEEASQLREQALRADGERQRAQADASRLAGRLDFDRQEHALSLAEADGRAERLAGALYAAEAAARAAEARVRERDCELQARAARGRLGEGAACAREGGSLVGPRRPPPPLGGRHRLRADRRGAPTRGPDAGAPQTQPGGSRSHGRLAVTVLPRHNRRSSSGSLTAHRARPAAHAR